VTSKQDALDAAVRALSAGDSTPRIDTWENPNGHCAVVEFVRRKEPLRVVRAYVEGASSEESARRVLAAALQAMGKK
jgi:hypothetical protein